MAAVSVNAWRAGLRIAAWPTFGFYLVWNIWWLAHRCNPPSIALAVFGLPAPTTGCTRALLCLLRGDWRDSLFWNLFLLPVLLLLVVSIGTLVRSVCERRGPVMPAILGKFWVAVLILAEITKLLQGSAAW